MDVAFGVWLLLLLEIHLCYIISSAFFFIVPFLFSVGFHFMNIPRFGGY